MSIRGNEDGEYDIVGSHPDEFERYTQLRLDDGDVIVYDTENEDAWIQSDGAIGIEYTV